MRPKIGIVIVNYNGLKFQNETIRSIKKQTYKNYDIIVVDNNSTDNSIQVLIDEFNDVKVIQVDDNVGVAAGNNIGICYAIKHNAEYIMLLNNDVVLDPYLIDVLVEKASKNVITIPKIYYFDKKNVIWSAGGKVDWSIMNPYHIGYKRHDHTISKEMDVEIAPTCCMLIHKSVFMRVGLMDEKFFMYYDDTDFCLRVINRKIKIRLIPSAKMWHKVSSSSGGEESKICKYYLSRNRLYLIKKYKKKVGKQYFNYSLQILKNAIMDYPRNYNNIYVIIGYIDFFRGKMYRKDFK